MSVSQRVFHVVQIQHRVALIDADRNRGDEILERVSLIKPLPSKPLTASCNATNAPVMLQYGFAISLDHIAIDLNGALAELAQIDHRAQAAPISR